MHTPTVLDMTYFLLRFYERWKETELAQAHAQGFSLEEEQLKSDWETILALADQQGHSLEQAHILVLAHILRRPIIVYGVKIVKNYRGENLGLVNFEGLLSLPLTFLSLPLPLSLLSSLPFLPSLSLSPPSLSPPFLPLSTCLFAWLSLCVCLLTFFMCMFADFFVPVPFQVFIFLCSGRPVSAGRLRLPWLTLVDISLPSSALLVMIPSHRTLLGPIGRPMTVT